jgi:hypothetical protein
VAIPGLCVWIRGKNMDELRQALICGCRNDEERACLDNHTLGPIGVNCSNDGTCVGILASKKAGKAPTLRWICEQLGLPTQNVAAFGDGNNDVDMFTVCVCTLMAAGLSSGKGSTCGTVMMCAIELHRRYILGRPFAV